MRILVLSAKRHAFCRQRGDGIVSDWLLSDGFCTDRGFDARKSHADLLQRADSLQHLAGLGEQLRRRRVEGPNVLVQGSICSISRALPDRAGSVARVPAYSFS